MHEASWHSNEASRCLSVSVRSSHIVSGLGRWGLGSESDGQGCAYFSCVKGKEKDSKKPDMELGRSLLECFASS